MKRLGVLVLVLIAGCSEAKHSISASDYDRSCSADADCVAIYEGSIGCCGVVACPNAAINAADSERYMSDVASRTETCSPAPPCVAPIDCPTIHPVCSNQVCELSSNAPSGDGG